MSLITLTDVLGVGLVSFCVAAAALIVASHVSGAGAAGHPSKPVGPGATEPATFLFDGSLLVDATDEAVSMLSRVGQVGGPWQTLMAFLGSHFDDIEPRLVSLAPAGRLDLWSDESADGPIHVTASRHAGMLRVTVVEPQSLSTTVGIDAQNFFAMERDVAMLEVISANMPCLTWKVTGDTVTWANAAYRSLAERVSGGAHPIGHAPVLPDADHGPGAKSRRVWVRPVDAECDLWFDVTTVECGDSVYCFAVSADAEVQSEGALREFIQTLAKTFAHLPIGLAIFDQRRRLALFNPALTDLIALPVAFLSARPTLGAFLDELRNRHVMPEPKDYRSWRQQITALEAQAARGTYSETWSLPGGQTYRVSGRPHPEGAIAFLFEDISSEVTLTRRFRTDLEQGQAVIDAMPEALAVFSPNGVLTMSNSAYARLWGIDPSTTLEEVSLADATRRWAGQTSQTPWWAEVGEFGAAAVGRTERSARVFHVSGRCLTCRLVPLSGGGTLVGFRDSGPAPVAFGGRTQRQEQSA